MLFIGRWHKTADKLPPSPDERTYRMGNAPEYIVIIEGASLPTTLMFYCGEWVDYEANTYRVIQWARLPRPPRRKNGKV